MTALSIAFVLLFALSSGIQGQTKLSGAIDDVTFTKEGNPYLVEKEILVPAGKTVVLPAGCLFLFESFAGMKVEGRLLVQGTSEDPVVFTSIQDSEFNPDTKQLPNPFDWNGIFVTEQSRGTHFNNFTLKYSVYGIKSQSQQVVVQNGLFSQNGQFHFTVDDKIQFVQENIPFSYGAEKRPSSAGEGVKNETTKPEKSKLTGKRKQLLRYGSLGIGVVGVGLGTVFMVRRGSWSSLMNDAKQNPNSHSPGDWDTYRSKSSGATAGSVVGYTLGALGLTGFGLTFAF